MEQLIKKNQELKNEIDNLIKQYRRNAYLKQKRKKETERIAVKVGV